MIIRSFSLLGTLILGFGFILPGSTRAQIPISLASNTGNASTQTASFGITPSAGTQQFLLTTYNQTIPAGVGTSPAVGTTPLNTYFGLATGTLAARNIQDGSGYLTQQVTLTVGTVVHFDYVFLTAEDNTAPGYHNDQAFFTINGVVNATIYMASQFTDLSPGNNYFDLQSVGTLTSGYTRFNYTVPATGNYTFGFGVGDVTTNTTQSGLLIDNINYTVVPEPGTLALLTLGAGLGALAARRRRSRHV